MASAGSGNTEDRIACTNYLVSWRCITYSDILWNGAQLGRAKKCVQPLPRSGSVGNCNAQESLDLCWAFRAIADSSNSGCKGDSPMPSGYPVTSVTKFFYICSMNIHWELLMPAVVQQVAMRPESKWSEHWQTIRGTTLRTSTPISTTSDRWHSTLETNEDYLFARCGGVLNNHQRLHQHF